MHIHDASPLVKIPMADWSRKITVKLNIRPHVWLWLVSDSNETRDTEEKSDRKWIKHVQLMNCDWNFLWKGKKARRLHNKLDRAMNNKKHCAKPGTVRPSPAINDTFSWRARWSRSFPIYSLTEGAFVCRRKSDLTGLNKSSLETREISLQLFI